MNTLIIGVVVYFILGVCYAIDFFHDEYEDMVENNGKKSRRIFRADNFYRTTMAFYNHHACNLRHQMREVIDIWPRKIERTRRAIPTRLLT